MGCILNKNQIHVVGDPSKDQSSTDTDKSHDRGGSATSKASRHSGDSGFDDDEAQLISEQKLIHRDILSRPPLGGRKLPERQEEKQILATLHEEGLIQRPIAQRAFGVSFEVIDESSQLPGALKKPPPRLARLEEKRKRKKKILTEEQIREKLRKAEERRKRHELLRLGKIQSLQKSDSTSITEPFDKTDDFGDTTKTKEELAAENREKKLKEKLERLRQKKEHAAEVRRRKAEAVAAGVAVMATTDDVFPGKTIPRDRDDVTTGVSGSTNFGGTFYD